MRSIETKMAALATVTMRIVAAFALLLVLGTSSAFAAAPVLTVTNAVTMPEDDSFNLGFSVSDSDSAVFTVVVTARSSNTNLILNSGLVPSGAGANRTLQINPLPHKFGTATITLVATDGAGESSTNTIALTVTFVNQLPTFSSAITDKTIREDAAATNFNFTIADFETAAGSLTLGATSTNTALIPNGNIAVGGSGASRTLTLTPAANLFGTSLIRVIVTDGNGGTTTNDFIVTVLSVNDAPAYTLSTNRVAVAEDAGLVTISNFLTSISVGPSNESSQSNWLVLTYSSNLFAQVPAVDSNGTLTFQMVTNGFGTNIVGVTVFDDGGTANGGVSRLSNAVTFAISAVNDAPVFTNLISNLTINEDAGRTNLPFAFFDVDDALTAIVFTVTSTNQNLVPNTNLVVSGTGSSRTLGLTALTNANGVTEISVVATDPAGASATNRFVLTVTAVNDLPRLSAISTRTMLEDGAATNVAFTVSDPDTDVTNITVTATVAPTNIVSLSVTNLDGTNRIVIATPFTNANGNVTITLVASDGVGSTTNTFLLTVTAVNDAPTFTLSTNLLSVAEDAGAVRATNFLAGITSGPTNEAGQTWAFTVTTTTNGFAYAALPAVATNGLLTFQTATNQNGSNLVTVVMTDSGGSANGGVAVLTNTFSIVVEAVNDLPRISGLSTNLIYREDTSTNFSFTISDVETAATNLTLAVSLSDTNLADVTITGSGASRGLAFAPKTNANGSAVATLVIGDGTVSVTNTYDVTVLSVNDAPTFSLGLASVTADKFGVAVTVANAATNAFIGATNEAGQTVSYSVSNSASGLFIAQPAIGTNGTLTFTPGSTGGNVTVTVRAVDSGGTANGGVDTSAGQTFTIVIPDNPFPYLAGRFSGLFYETNALAHDSSGYFSFVLGSSGTFTGYALRSGTSNQFAGQFSISNANAVAAISNTTVTLHMTIDTGGNWTESVSGVASNSSSWTSALLGYLQVHSAAFQTDLAGEYNVAVPGFANAATGPAGSATLSLTVSNNGTVVLGGYLADDTAVIQRSHISRAGLYPLYVPAYAGGVNGSLSGWLEFSGGGLNAFAAGSDLTWIKKTGGVQYTAGFTNQSAVVGSIYDSSLTALLTLSSGQVILAGGNLSTAITNSVTISHDVITVDPTATNGLVLAFDRAGGEIRGSFVNAGTTNLIYSVILQSTNQARGYFIGPSQGGSFLMK